MCIYIYVYILMQEIPIVKVMPDFLFTFNFILASAIQFRELGKDKYLKNMFFWWG